MHVERVRRAIPPPQTRERSPITLKRRGIARKEQAIEVSCARIRVRPLPARARVLRIPIADARTSMARAPISCTDPSLAIHVRPIAVRNRRFLLGDPVTATRARQTEISVQLLRIRRTPKLISWARREIRPGPISLQGSLKESPATTFSFPDSLSSIRNVWNSCAVHPESVTRSRSLRTETGAEITRSPREIGARLLAIVVRPNSPRASTRPRPRRHPGGRRRRRRSAHRPSLGAERRRG